MGLNPDDIVQISYLGRVFGQKTMLVRNYVFTGEGVIGQTPAQATDAILTAVVPGGDTDAVAAAYLQCLPTNWQLEYVKAQIIKPIRYAAQTDEIFAAGTWASTALVPNNQGAVVVRSALAGRKHRGVVKVGPLPSNAATAGLLTAEYYTALEAFANTLDNPLTIPAIAGALYPVLYHFATNTKDAITSHETQKQARVIRRRTIGVGE